MLNKKTLSLTLAIIVIALALIMLSMIVWDNKIKTTEKNKLITNLDKKIQEQIISAVDTENWETYKNDEYGFKFNYPKEWFLDGSRLSSQKIEDYEIGSDNAPIHFGLYTEDKNLSLNNPEILDFNRYEYQLKNSERNAPDSLLKINGSTFKRYDLIDYGRYEGDSAGEIILLIGPKINDQDLFLIFEWQQYPGGKTLKINNSQDFINIASTLNFTDSHVNFEQIGSGHQEFLIQSETWDDTEIKIVDNNKENKYILSVSGEILDTFNYPENLDNTISFRFEKPNYVIVFYQPGLTPGQEVIYDIDNLEKITTELMFIYTSSDGEYIISYSPIRSGSVGLVVEKINDRIVKKWLSEEEVDDVIIEGDILEYKERRLEDDNWSSEKINLTELE